MSEGKVRTSKTKAKTNQTIASISEGEVRTSKTKAKTNQTKPNNREYIRGRSKDK